MKQVHIDFSNITGPIKPLHGVNNAPEPDCEAGYRDKLGQAGIPYVRLHDMGGHYAAARYVDIANVFPDFEKDPADPASYNFTFTDWLISDLYRQGCEVVYRLGCSIECQYFVKPRNIIPPANNLKWAKICEGIIRHYNEGWADGYRFGIRYWEIWNEPDNTPDMMDSPMWRGTPKQYYALYETASIYLKQRFPDLMIGGYASCGFYAILGGYVKAANSSERTEHFIDFFHGFLRHIRKKGCPLDFFSWHSYADAASNVVFADYARKTLDEYGYTGTEMHLNEWNPGRDNRGQTVDMALITQMMCRMHTTDVRVMNYYDAQPWSSYCGVFDGNTRKVAPAYYSFVYYNALYRLGSCAMMTGDCADMLAATDGEQGAVLISNPDAEACEIDLTLIGLSGKLTMHVTAPDCTQNTVDLGSIGSALLTVPAQSAVLLTIQ
ncbi:MAG: hypothetical protein IJW70_06835 [Clostridia bacterium]|nr:hypothetical protein [Clostridia bacterium]